MMQEFHANTSQHVRNIGFCLISTTSPFEQINAGTEVSVILPSGKVFIVVTGGSSVRSFGSAWGIPIRMEDIWHMINN